MNNRSYLLAIGLVCLAIFFPHLNVVEVNIMEARNFITAREMLDYGNWIHTTMNLEPRYEKPPLPTWMTAVSGAIFGMKNLFGLRLPAVLSVVFLVFTFYYLGIQILQDKKQAFIGTLILATSFFSGINDKRTTADKVHKRLNLYNFLFSTLLIIKGYKSARNEKKVQAPDCVKKLQ